MKLALQINNYDWTVEPTRMGATFAEIARTADEVGFSSIAVADHLWAVPPWMGPAEAPVPESYTTLAYLAGSTKRIQLVALASPPNFRYPAMLAKIVSTLDVLSAGRAWLGIGAGDYEDEARGLRMQFPPLAESFEMLAE